MEIGLAILLFVCMTALLYVLLSLKISKQVDLQMKEFYKTRIHSDIQEFYREMEGYAALFENRIQRFRVLVERNETIAYEHFQAQETTKSTQRTVSETSGINKSKEQVKGVREKIAAKTSKGISVPNLKIGKATEKKTGLKKTSTPHATPSPSAATKQQAANLPSTPQAARRSAVTQPGKEDTPLARVADVKMQSAIVQSSEQFRTVPEQQLVEDNDSAIAEELMKDIFANEEARVAQQSEKSAPREAVGQHTAEQPKTEKSMKNILSRIGKAIEPVIFGEKKVQMPVNETVAKKATRANETAAPSNFTEVLRRAEQIKAEKKAERERAEIDARSEFYAKGDSFQNVSRLETTTVTPAIPAIAREIQSNAPRHDETHRNSLAMKELDQHTINFLIDSLAKDNGYRKQALRALTENNIALDEIARLSKIDIGELELMRQLNRF